MLGLPPETPSRACGVLLLLLALAARAEEGGAPRPPRPCTAPTTTHCSPDAAFAAAAAPAAAASTPPHGDTASLAPLPELMGSEDVLMGLSPLWPNDAPETPMCPTYYLQAGYAKVHKVLYRSKACRQRQQQQQQQQPHQRSERSCLGCLYGGVSGGRLIGFLRVAGERQRRRRSRRSELTECPLDSLLYSLLGGLLNGGESGGRSIGSPRVASDRALW